MPQRGGRGGGSLAANKMARRDRMNKARNLNLALAPFMFQLGGVGGLLQFAGGRAVEQIASQGKANYDFDFTTLQSQLGAYEQAALAVQNSKRFTDYMFTKQHYPLETITMPAACQQMISWLRDMGTWVDDRITGLVENSRKFSQVTANSALHSGLCFSILPFKLQFEAAGTIAGSYSHATESVDVTVNNAVTATNPIIRLGNLVEASYINGEYVLTFSEDYTNLANRIVRLYRECDRSGDAKDQFHTGFILFGTAGQVITRHFNMVESSRTIPLNETTNAAI